jgi:FHA domain-containing protein
MSQEGFCEKHGPYDASLGGCPYCAQESGLPQAPPPLDDEMPTDPWGGMGRPGRSAYDEDETDIGFRARQYEEEDDLTQFPDRGPGMVDSDHTVVEHAEQGLLGFLIVKSGMRRGQVYRVSDGAIVGRDQATIILRDPKVSKPHAKFTVEDDQFFVWDFGSANGTYVNGERIRQATALKENDEIKMGDATFVLKTMQ